MASICSGLKWYLKPGMRGVPLAITSCIAFGLPLADAFDRTGPYCTLLSCGLAWQTRHDWLNRCCPCRWVVSRSCARAGVAASASAIGQAFDHACRMSFPPDCCSFVQGYASAQTSERCLPRRAPLRDWRAGARRARAGALSMRPDFAGLRMRPGHARPAAAEARMVPFFVQIKCHLGKSYSVANALAESEIASEIYSTAGDFDL